MNTARACWNTAEKPLIDDADGDVLTILDCCFASNIQKDFEEDVRIYELLTASGPDKPTSAPGPKSFTRALIDSLQELLDEYSGRSFSTYSLNDRIISQRR